MRPGTLIALDRLAVADGQDVRDLRRRAAAEVLQPTTAYPQQAHVVREVARAPRSTVQANRRAGKTHAIAALIEGRLIHRDNYVVNVLTSVLRNPSKTWLDCADKESFLQRMQRLGLAEYMRVDRRAESIVRVRFAWGSVLSILHIRAIADIEKHRGQSADLWWCDEAQSVDHIGLALSRLVNPTLADSHGQVILSGTPGQEIDGQFYHATNGDGSQWVRLACYSWQNPHFGNTDRKRWARLVQETIAVDRHRYDLSEADVQKLLALSEADREALANGHDHPLRKWFDALDPDLRREGFGAWVVGGSELVFRWYPRPDDDTPRYWAQDAATLWDVGAQVAASTLAGRVAQLPTFERFGRALPYSWHAIIIIDIGWNPSTTAIVVPVWADQHETVYVLWAEEALEQDDDVTRDRALAIAAELRSVGVAVTRVVADVNGTRAGTRAAWDRHFAQQFGGGREWVHEPQKAHKEQQIFLANLDLTAGRWRFIAGDPLDIAGRHLRKVPFDPLHASRAGAIDKFRKVTLPDGRVVVPGDHTLDAWRYSFPFIPRLDAPTQDKRSWVERRYAAIQELDA